MNIYILVLLWTTNTSMSLTYYFTFYKLVNSIYVIWSNYVPESYPFVFELFCDFQKLRGLLNYCKAIE